jgi:uncharacterized protein (TIGR03083 family)
VEVTEHLDALRGEATATADAARRGLDVPVPSCPGWSVGDLAVHLGVTHRWAAETVRSRSDSWVRGAKERWGIDPGDPQLVDWLLAGAEELASVLEGTDPETPVFTFGEPHTVRFWPRRQAHETTIHRWDAERAHGEPSPIETELAADGVDEHLSVFAPFRRTASTRAGEGETFHLHRTDGDGEWVVTFPAGGNGIEVRREHAKGDVAVRGAASDLVLFLWQRIPADRLEVFGDAALLDRWFELVPPV